MSAIYERTFVVKVPVARAWSAFIEREGREAWMSPPGRDPIENPDAEYPAPGFPKMELKLGKIEEHKLLQWSTHHTADGTPAWLETTVTFEEVKSGTRITITRAGFGETPEWQLFKQSSSLGMDHSLIDLVAYLETGVNVSRHFAGHSSIGASMAETAAGIKIIHAVDGGFAAETGMRAGDLLISIGGAGVYHRSDVWFIQREHGPGTEMQASYVRGGALLQGRGRLSEKDYTETHGYGGA
jgi:Activator of Hsp90 ATPase homolog 1-like protein